MTYEIEPELVKERLENGEELNIIDVREDFEYDYAHIPGAILIPLGTLPVRFEELDRNNEYIMVCRTANRSAYATMFLIQNGFKDVKNMLGGMVVWSGEIEYTEEA